jgi:hypothetical protein
MPETSHALAPDTAATSSSSITDPAAYELQQPFAEWMLRAFRLGNTALDILFYDVGVLTKELFAKGDAIVTAAAKNTASAPHPLKFLDLSALTNPSGSVIVVDANLPPYVRKPFTKMYDFLAYANGPEGEGLRTLAISGVGSSAYGSVALAWDVSTALGEPVAAVVPGYGLADVVPQALGGWFGFGVYDAMQTATQDFLARVAPSLATVGKELALTTPHHEVAATGAPVFRHGSAASDDVHAILENVLRITRLVGHSKGALAIENALRSLPQARTQDLTVLTFGCVIAEEQVGTKYKQYLGWVDPLGTLNSWGRSPDARPFAGHSTNTFLPLSLSVTALVGETTTDPTPRKPS